MHANLIAESEVLLRMYRPFPKSSYHPIHSEILDAIKADEDTAVELIRHHLRSSSQLIRSKQMSSGDTND
jgi:DNA-binding GntR family transcriptional regulator